MIRTIKILKLLTSAVALAAVCACATPATRNIPISKEELRLEQQAQLEMTRRITPKPLVRRYSELSVYQTRLIRVSAPLARSAKKFCRSGSCDYKFQVVNQPGLNAWTDGKSVTMTAEMMDFLSTDKELATVIAHELAHNVMQHHGKQMQNMIFGAILDVAAAAGGANTQGLFSNIGSMSYSQAFENEADYVGIYIMANAAHDISNVHEIWRKMTVQTRANHASFFSSHPSNAERYIRMKRAIAEVHAKKKANKKLIPNYNA